MALRDVYVELANCWDDVMTRVGADKHILIELTRAAVDKDDDDEHLVAGVRWLAQRLPTDHPVIQAILLDDDRSPVAISRWQQALVQLGRLTGTAE